MQSQRRTHWGCVRIYSFFFYQKIMSVIGKGRKYFLLLNEKCQHQWGDYVISILTIIRSFLYFVILKENVTQKDFLHQKKKISTQTFTLNFTYLLIIFHFTNKYTVLHSLNAIQFNSHFLLLCTVCMYNFKWIERLLENVVIKQH